ncbi:MAG: serine hydrolase [Kiritimatiellaeota bacterium]|nr:serine hydrolase [Kiritimatiellota bacterium]
MKTLSRLCLALCLAQFVFAAPNPSAPALDTARLAVVPKQLQKFVDEGAIAGAVTLVARHEKVVALEVVGLSNLETKRALKPDDLFWIASMTKPITATAVLMLQDAGKLNVNDPVEKYLPEFHGQWMIAERGTNTMKLVPPARPITLHDLLTHTSGISDMPPPRVESTLAEFVMGYANKPLQFEPGSKWSYSTAGINVLGRIVEVVSGQPFAEFLDEHILHPLGMKNTTFWPSARQAKRLATAYAPGPGGKGLAPTDIYFIKGGLDNHSRPPLPGGGLFSTAEDLAKFYQFVLNDGVVGGKRLLSKEAVAQMTSVQTGDLKCGFVDGMAFGLGWGVVKQPQGVTAMLSPGTFGHGGAYGTQGWVDTQNDLIYVMMIQRAKLPNGDASDMRRVFQETVVGALKK